ncbi:hypothetical protein [Rhizobium sp. L43]|uniref:hypothetical protein n=1 Tax=Rhizobium sp. L43 TaxID=2035452 RepID=UPI000BE9B7CC|nr:hypothetical protein [Rhizobium sp. L43]PDS75461.1 hypothetical protein CO667_26630 [Rhizobium sp. L43]
MDKKINYRPSQSSLTTTSYERDAAFDIEKVIENQSYLEDRILDLHAKIDSLFPPKTTPDDLINVHPGRVVSSEASKIAAFWERLNEEERSNNERYVQKFFDQK